MKTNKILIPLLLLSIASCKAPDISYLSDLQNNQILKPQPYNCMRLEPDSKLTIYVKSIDPDITNLFNLFNTSSGNSTAYSNNNSLLYTVDSKGNIDLPQLGTIHVQGMSREEVAASVKEAIESRFLAKDVTVVVNFQGITYHIAGEVGSPGRKEITKEYTTIYDALSESGDISLGGRRDNVLLLRKETDALHAYRLDLRYTDSIINSPAFYIHQGDYVYVEPNKKRRRETTVLGNSVLTPSFWMSIASFVASMSTLIITQVRK